jgi:hypothetical protein
MVCTGQTKCYDDVSTMKCPSAGKDYYGQDGYYFSCGFCIERSFTISGNDPEKIVTDENIGLKWQRYLPSTYDGCTLGTPIGSKCSWTEAVSYCENLSYGENSEWRLPAIKELLTLVDFGRSEPAFDTEIFLEFPSSAYFWSVSSGVPEEPEQSAEYAFSFHFERGTFELFNKSGFSSLICVSGEKKNYYSNLVESTVSGKTIITDSTTGLIWTKDQIVVSTWNGALSYCENLQYAGNDDWRLPNIVELLTLFDDSLRKPASSFPVKDVYGVLFWSSTPDVYNGYAAWWIDLKSGLIEVEDKSSQYLYAICVR